MRLVEIPGIDCERRPVRSRQGLDRLTRLLKPLDAAIPLRRQSDFASKCLNEPALTQIDAFGSSANRHMAGRFVEDLERGRYGRMSSPASAPPREERVLHDRKPSSGRSCGELHSKFDGPLSPEGVEVHMRISQFIHGAKKRKGSAGFEVDAHDRRVLCRINRKAGSVRPRDDGPGKPAATVELNGIVNPNLIVDEVEHQLNRTAGQNPFARVHRFVRAHPNAVNDFPKRAPRNVERESHRDTCYKSRACAGLLVMGK
jgi:hypothetical protein